MTPYNLQDTKLLEEQPGDVSVMVWQPEKPVIVIGKSNSPEKSVNLELTEKFGVEVLQRMSGGETVYLSPNTMVISTKIRHTDLGGSKSIFKSVNQLIINALEFFGCHEAVYRGISDIALGKKKILGSAMYKGKDYLFYHAVLNLSEDIETIAKFILHPEREPDYRQGRSHKEFVTSLKDEGYDIEYSALKKQIERNFMLHFKDNEVVINF